MEPPQYSGLRSEEVYDWLKRYLDTCQRNNWDEDEAKKWSLINLITDEDYIAALAVNGHGFELRYWEGR